MKFAVAKEHRDFFRKQGQIEFNGLLSEEQCDQLLDKSLLTLSERLNIPALNVKLSSVDTRFLAGFDLWRGSSGLKKLILQKNLAETASELLEIKPLRMGYDQLLPSLLSSARFEADAVYKHWLMQPTSLRERSSIQGILCGLMVCVGAPPIQENLTEVDSEQSSLFATKKGNGVFFDPDAILDFNAIAQRSGYSYLMIVYTKNVSVYLKVGSDPHTNAFRDLGYNFGDRLSDRFHPLVFF